MTNVDAGEILPPGAVPYTDRQRAVIDFGWQLAQRYYPALENTVPPMIFLWFEEDGWQGGYSVHIERHDPGTMAVTTKEWERLHLGAPYNPN